MRDFRSLNVWEKSHTLTLNIYQITSQFPKEELYGLTSQIRRSSISIPSNIAEGCGQSSEAQFLRFLNIAFGSASELEYQILLAKDLKFLDNPLFKELLYLVREIKRMLSSLISAIKT